MRALVLAAACAAMLRAVVPFGYMLTLAGGGVGLVPCTGLFISRAVVDVAAHHPQAHHHNTDGAGPEATHAGREMPAHRGHDAMASCPFAASCCTVLSAPSNLAGPSDRYLPPAFAGPAAPAARRILRHFAARAPPLGH